MAKSRRSRKIRSKRRINTKRRIKIRSNRKRIKFGGSQGASSRGRADVGPLAWSGARAETGAGARATAAPLRAILLILNTKI